MERPAGSAGGRGGRGDPTVPARSSTRREDADFLTVASRTAVRRLGCRGEDKDPPAFLVFPRSTTRPGGSGGRAACRRVGRWRGGVSTCRPGCHVSRGFPPGAQPVTIGHSRSVSSARLIEPCMRFSRTRLTDVVHRRHSAVPRQSLPGLGATTIPPRLIRPSWSADWKATTARPYARVR